jgi:hypothetical protein
MSTILVERIKHYVDVVLKEKTHDNFERKAWMQGDKSNVAWVRACPKTGLLLNT